MDALVASKSQDSLRTYSNNCLYRVKCVSDLHCASPSVYREKVAAVQLVACVKTRDRRCNALHKGVFKVVSLCN